MAEQIDREAKRRARLGVLLQPSTTAVLTMELQNGVVGEDALLPALAEQVSASGTVLAAARVCDAARAVGARVVHCTAEQRTDGAGTTTNCTIFARSERSRAKGIMPLEVGGSGAEVVAEIGPEEADIIIARWHGLTPFTSTSLDQMLRNMGVATLVVTGVSVNLGVIGLCLSAVDLGYQVVLPTDAVAGVPADYADLVIENSLAFITTLTSSDEVVEIWS